jgi:predicted DNA-binding protein
MPNQYKAGTVVFWLRMPAELKEKLMVLAAKKGRSATELAREAIRQYLARHKSPEE